MLDQFLPHIISAIVAAIMGLFVYLTRSYFSRIHDDLKELSSSVDRLSGRFDAVSSDIRANTTAVAVMQSELKAVWRFVDNAYERASDTNGGE